jgi:uncharacterized membrane protein
MNGSKSLRVSWPHVVLGLVGLAISYYSVVVKRRIDAGSDTGCGFTQSVNCDAVIGSAQYGTFLGLPWGTWGMAFFVIVLLSAVNNGPAKPHTARTEAAVRLAVATAGILTSFALTYISKGIIGVWCPVCMATHATTFLLFVVSLVAFLKTPAAPAEQHAPPS